MGQIHEPVETNTPASFAGRDGSGRDSPRSAVDIYPAVAKPRREHFRPTEAELPVPDKYQRGRRHYNQGDPKAAFSSVVSAPCQPSPAATHVCRTDSNQQ